jgi:hypothetical protein
MYYLVLKNHLHYIEDIRTAATDAAVAAAAVVVVAEHNKRPRRQDLTLAELYQFHSGNIGRGLNCKRGKLKEQL